MLTVTFDCELSGKSNTRRPLSSWYSIIPSTVVIFLGPAAARQNCAVVSKRTLTRILRNFMLELAREHCRNSSDFAWHLADSRGVRRLARWQRGSDFIWGIW